MGSRQHLDELKLELVGWDECHTDQQQRDRAVGHNANGWPTDGVTMIGLLRLANLEACLRAVVEDGIPGDVIECGAWRGGACIFARAVLDSMGDDRVVICADSFRGVCPPDPERYPVDAGAPLLSANPALAVPRAEVEANFARFGVSTERVEFLEGWFRDTLPALDAQGRQLAVMRLDGDLYESTWVALENLYPHLSVGGFVIVDDYDDVPVSGQAVDDYRAEYGITEPLCRIDHGAVYWQRQS
jgi:O-methyltransferase